MNNHAIQNRSEILFLYDIKDANPNGDPMDENKPRIDEETRINIVTDVRLKRTIRDYLMNFRKREIFVREIVDNEGKIQDAKQRAGDFLKDIDEKELAKKDFHEQKTHIKEMIIKNCIDVRLFGATIPLELNVKKKKVTGSIVLTGPVQFRMGRSLHKVEIKHIKGTGAFASKPGATKKTFREEDILPYSLICFYGIINENTAGHSGLTEEDVSLFNEAIWNGTKNLISRSKAGQMPRFILKINYNENSYHIGDLDKMISLVSEKDDIELRDVSDFTIDLSEIKESILKNKDKIKSIEFKKDDRISIDMDGFSEVVLKDLDIQ